MSSPKQVNDLLKHYALRAQKRLGQNFLCDRNSLNRIVGAANLSAEDSVIEIGGGLGALTQSLAAVCKRVTTVEIDLNLEKVLRGTTCNLSNVQLIFDDFLKLDHTNLFEDAFAGGRGAVVANIPYYITTPILEILLKHKIHLNCIVLLVQREFAERLAAPAGHDDCGSLSLFAQYHARVTIIGSVPRNVFLPSPDVDSTIVLLQPVLPGTVSVVNEERMFALIRAGFGQRRKTLLNALMRAPKSYDLGFGMEDRSRIEQLLLMAKIDASRRGETLNLEEYARIADTSLPD